MMFFYILLTILILLTFLSFLRLRVIFSFRDKLIIELKILFLKVVVVGKKEKIKKKTPKESKIKTKKKKQQKPPAKEEKPKSKKLTGKDMLLLFKEAVKPLIEKFFRYLKIDYYDIDITIATGDAATTAIAYGATSAALYSLLSLLSEVKLGGKGFLFSKAVKSRAKLVPDFAGESSDFNGTISFSIKIWQIVACAILGGKGFLLFYKVKSTK